MKLKLRTRALPVLLALSLTATVAVVGPTSSAEAGSPNRPKPVKTKSVKVKDVPPIAAPAESADLKKAVDKTAEFASRPVRWPAPGHQSVAVNAAGKPAGPVAVRSAKRTAPATVDLDFLDQAASERAGISGVLVKASTAAKSDVQLSFDYSGYENAYGGDFGTRLEVVALPACVLTTPKAAGCSTSTPLKSTNDPAAKTVTTTAPLSAQQSVFAVTAGSDSSAGDYSATSLSASSSWSAGGSSGDFTWSYPLRVPPAAAGPTPSLAFSYSAQSVDGRTSATNNQVSWVGEGFDLTESFVERKYTSCDEDGQVGKYDQCWKYDNATLTLNGKSNELVRSSGADIGASTWKLKNDDGSKVEKIIGTDVNGDALKEYWKVTTTDGTQYYFGKNKLKPGLTAVTNSVFTAPVYGDDVGEPCHTSAAGCDLGWRWNLDYVVDLHGNAMSYWYTKELNNYAKNGVASPGTSYVRGGYLNRIDYGLRDDTLSDTTKAPQQVVFTTAERCLANCSVLNATTKGNWPDVPFDQVCEGTTACTNKVSPTFFTRKRLYQITTQVLNGTTYQPVDFWQTNLTFPTPGDVADGKPMWLNGISHSGKVGTAISMPDVTFKPVGLANRVDTRTDGLPGLVRYRVGEINTETGAKIMVNYAGKECVSGERPAKDTNTKRCYPVKWKPQREVEREDWFNKYVVDNVVTSDQTGNGATMVTQYAYSGGGAWHYQESPMLKDDDKTWSEWRGYSTVTTYSGDPGDNTRPRSRSVTKYFRGMDGDKLENTTAVKNVDVTDTAGGVRADAEALAGSPREQVTYQDATSNAEVSGQITDYIITQKASYAVPGGTLKSTFVGTSATQNRIARDGGRPDQVTTTATTYDPDNNLPTKVTDFGDASKTDDQTCTITNYLKNTATWLLGLPIRIVTSSGACDSVSPNPPESRVLTDVRTFYDSKAYGVATLGDATLVQRLHHYTDNAPVYQNAATKTYDALGRAISSGDALGRITTTAYTPALTGPLTQTVIKQPTVNNYSGTPVNFATTTTYKAEWGLPSKTTDVNGKVTEMAYDGLGRLTGVWLPSQAPAATKLANTKYTYTISNTAPSTIRTDSLNIQATGYNTSYQLFDSLLRDRQSQSPGADGGRVISETRYDSRGLAIYQNSDVYNSAAPAATLVDIPNASVPNQTFIEYDGSGRTVKSTFMSMLQPKWSTTTIYGGDTTTVLPPAGSPAAATVTDAQGQVIERREFKGNTATGTPDVTKYTFDVAGRMTRMDGAGAAWTYKYDLRGRKIESTDPDAGKTTSAYDEGDRLISTTDSANNTVVTTYDALDRKTGLYKTSVAPENLLADWKYDKTDLLGQVAESASYTDGKAGPAYRTLINSRNVLYKPTQVTRVIPNAEGIELDGSYWTNYDYKPDAKTLEMTSLSAGGGLGAEDMYYDYNALGLPIGLHSDRIYTHDTEYNPFGDVTKLLLGSASDMEINNIYEDGTRRLARTTAGKTNIFADHAYTYDPTGNVLKDQNLVDSAAGGDAQCFQYDGQQRVTQAWTPANADCTQAPSSLGLGGVAPYWQSWTYTPIGLRKTQVDHSTAGDVTSTFNYNTDQPHTLANVTQTGAPTKTYDYDTRGNTTVRPGQTLNWNPQGALEKLTSSAGDTNYVYDAEGALLVRRSQTETTLFLGELELTLDKATRKVTGKRQYEFAGQTIGVRSANGTATSDMSWLVPDYHGTSQVAVDADTMVATKRYAKPFGDPRGPTVAWPDDHGFLGKPEDKDTGLTTLGAREYDPTIGRFISVDPLLDANDPQQMLGYTYANDNPISGSDPTGLLNREDSAGGGYTDDDVDTQYCPGCANDNPNPNGPNAGYGGYGYENHDGGTNHHKKKHSFGGWIKDRVNDVEDKVDEAHEWAKDHASEIGTGIAIGVAVVGAAAFCVGTAGVGCVVIAGAIAGAAGAGLGYGAEVALDDNKTFSTADLAKQVALGGASGAIGGAAGAGVGAIGKALVAKAAPAVGRVIAKTAATACSFSGTTTVLMADGSHKPIAEVRVGDKVVATDPETGEQAAKTVEHVFVHDDTVQDLVVDGETITTTEDHPFWSVTDQRFERADALGTGEQVLGADGRKLTVSGLKAGTQRETLAYNLSVQGIHTYHVGDRAILVHNACKAGIYIVNTAKGVYVGQSKNISKRLAQHVAKNKFTQAEVDNAVRYCVPGSKTDREIAEQLMIDMAGGKRNLLNEVNPIGDGRIGLMGPGYSR
ncbi:polymorphic toxin-type HINT domain-containing protein [Kribbella sp. NPDC058245]|uniref:polymorphic toxin-type HINT domain-containing protein n=1 Tax=Kribbella sp. NPDC058245 TaxID=3346399 RepID=UPI0036E66719